MSKRRPPLSPYPLRVLLGRIAQEWETRHRIFDMPTGRFFHSDPGLDLSVPVFGTRASTPVGPAAGPHTQLAANFVLGWLAGARVFEMKTVQVLDELEIDRPCIDMRTVGYNTEWSQELSIEQSLREYVKAWLLLDILRGWEPLRPSLGHPGRHVFDLSVGYDLEGISSARMDLFIRTVLDASEVIDELRPDIVPPFAGWADHLFSTRLVDSVTLSTFHGCPPDEIEAITRHLMTTYGLDVTVKLNPTLLGHDLARQIVQDRLGYRDVELDPGDFEADLQFEDAIPMFRRLSDFATEQGRTFGIKLTNTLVVDNRLGRLPGEKMYLSGPPLHVLAVTLLDRLVDALPGLFRLGSNPGPVPVSWSAGVDRENFPSVVGIGVAPVTVCTNLLKPGGYGHLSAMLAGLGRDLHTHGYTDVAGWVAHVGMEAELDGLRDAVHAYAMRHTWPDELRRYTALGTAKRLREVPRLLETWDCVSCNLCVTVCPNDAMLHLPAPEAIAGVLTEKWQYFCLAELCNDCGNCVTFCPEDGEPFVVKPRLFIDPERFAAEVGGRYLLTRSNGNLAVVSGEGDEHLALVTAFLDDPLGLPFRPQDLSSTGRSPSGALSP
ncbi:MAG TPA: glutamate synthase [Acidimicrobiia bacterium]